MRRDSGVDASTAPVPVEHSPGIIAGDRDRWHPLAGVAALDALNRPPLPRARAVRPVGQAGSGVTHIPPPRRGTMEGKAMVAEQASRVCAEASLQEGEPVTLVIDDERFFGWVASASHAQRLSCVT